MGIQIMIVCCYHLIAGSNFRSTSSFRIPAFKNKPRLVRIRFRQLIAAVKRDILGIVHVLSIHKLNRIRNWGVNNSYGLISGNINQTVLVDSMQCDFDNYPYRITTFARQMIIRNSNITERSLVTRCFLQSTVRSDNNPQGFMAERFEILENRDIRTVER